MKYILTVVNRLYPLWVIAGCAWAYYRPEAFSGFLSERVILFFGITMFGIGVTLELEQAAKSVRRVDKILLGTLAQYSIMPLAAYSLTRIFAVQPELALGLVLTGCVPGAMSSNVLAYIARGDVAYSVALTTVSTFLSPWITPALTLLLLGDRVEIPYIGMMMIIIKSVFKIRNKPVCFFIVNMRNNQTFIDFKISRNNFSTNRFNHRINAKMA